MTTDIVEIDSLNLAGDGVGHLRGQAIAVPFTIPGERVRVDVDENPGRSRAATLIEIDRASAHRVIPRCRHFGPQAQPGVGACGGCSWQHIAYAEQLRIKTGIIDRIVRDAVPSAPRALPMLAGTPIDSPWGYRHKVHFVFADGSRARGRSASARMGHYVRGSRRVVPVVECPVHAERGNHLAFQLRDAYARAQITADTLKSIAVRVGAHTPEIMATLVVRDDRDKALRSATKRVIESARPTAFHLNVHPKDDAFIFGRETRRIAGTARMREEVGDVAFVMSPTAFFQTNVDAAAILVSRVLEALPAPSTVLDLYAGAGLFALSLARAGHRVIAVEENRDAVADGEASLRVNRIDTERCRFIARRVEVALASLSKADAAVLDPPREGASAAVLDHVFKRIHPPLAAYVSCNPEALGRDLRVIASHGYRVVSTQPVDMFPHTAHIETVVILEGIRRP